MYRMGPSLHAVANFWRAYMWPVAIVAVIKRDGLVSVVFSLEK